MLPFKALPYGYAPGWCFPVIELSLYVFWMWCALDARRKGRAAMAYLLGGTAFGVLLETFEVMTGSYTYGRFQVMLWHAPMQVPPWVGCGWGVIMYTARLFSDAARLPLVAAKEEADVAVDVLEECISAGCLSGGWPGGRRRRGATRSRRCWRLHARWAC